MAFAKWLEDNHVSDKATLVHLQRWGTKVNDDGHTQKTVKEALQAIDALKTAQGLTRWSNLGL